MSEPSGPITAHLTPCRVKRENEGEYKGGEESERCLASLIFNAVEYGSIRVFRFCVVNAVEYGSIRVFRFCVGFKLQQSSISFAIFVSLLCFGISCSAPTLY